MTEPPPLAHLGGAAAPLRQVMAAHLVRGVAHVVEIGGAGAPITGFLTHAPDSVTVIDPKIAPLEAGELNGRPCRVRHVAAKFQAADVRLPPAGYAVVMIGLSLKGHGAKSPVDPGLVGLMSRASLVVIDHAVRLERAAAQLPALIAAARLEQALAVDFTLSDGVIESTPFAARRLALYRPAGGP